MSSSTAAATPSTSTSTNYLANLGLGYFIVIALGFLVLLSALILSSYLCCRASRRRARAPNPNLSNPGPDGIVLPRVIFVAEDAEDNESDDENVAVGLDENVINSYPKFQYSKDSAGSGSAGNNTTCSICLCEYGESEMLRMMPECHHYFHLCCLDSWLKLNGSCPVCRNSPMPTPLSTPLQEVVPLAQYAADRRRR